SGTARVSNLHIDAIQNFSATASATADVAGTVSSPTATVSGRLADVRYHSQDHGDLDIHASLQSNIASLQLESAKYDAEATAEVGLNVPYSYTASVRAKNSPLEYRQYRVTTNGTVQASGDLQPFSARQIRFEDFSARGEGVDIKASGALAEGVRVNATATLSQLPLSGIQLGGEA